MDPNTVHAILLSLVFVGAINWGLVAFDQNLVTTVDRYINKNLSTDLPIEKAIYIAVAVSALYLFKENTLWLLPSVHF